MSTAEEIQFDDSGLHRWTDDQRFEVSRERLASYAAATNDPIEAHRRGDVAAPVFAIVPVFEALLAPAVDVMPVEVIPRIVHGEQDFHFHRTIRPGDKLVSRGQMIGYQGLEKGTRAAILLECRTEDGELVNEQYVTAFVRGINVGKAVGELSPDHTFDDTLRENPPTAEVVANIDADQTFRYAPAAGDPMPIHLDEEVAKGAGFPGIIAHGLCTMAFTSWAVLTQLADSDVNRLRRFAVRFAKPVLPGDDIKTRIWLKDKANGISSYAFETARGEELVITDGLALVDDR
ncbi:MaoC/PaaZ C-terminal domain-containing protein [Mycobacterium sp.]|uniref:MaoC/PaaZ C-terminal domain-containing protein n=1 Tax=Mycobacterium sp. TaxID=1785 RepID=UPI00127DE9D8|nr:MaoC/PaaZ C-terminal domain-containing protein [Mycobacterium sp.]KAA8962550.1 MAG: dehydratase [Mycobacterium sp.]